MATADTTADDGGRTPFVSIVARIAEHARRTPDKDAIVFVRHAPEGLEAEHVSYAQLDREAHRYAAWLASRCVPGDRVLLVFPPGLHFFKALIACEYAGLAAVPVPSPSRSTKRESRVAHIARDAGVHLVLTTARHKPLTEEILEDTAGSVECVATDDADFEAALDAAPAWTAPEIGPETTAILQYTSGSTSDPKGVVVPHRALAYNCVLIEQALEIEPEIVVGTWLPHYHDMGLIGTLLQPVHLGATIVQMAPTDFLRHPRAWLEIISHYRITGTTAPNFAYDLMAKSVNDAQVAALDLSHVRHVLNGAEPVNAETMARFARRFAAAGLRETTLVPCYGLAEATLFVSATPVGRGTLVTPVDAADLERNVFTPAGRARPAGEATQALVSSGRVLGLDVRIVDPDTLDELPDGRIGEIWVRGESVAAGYWGKPEESARSFDVRTAQGHGGFLRTGDLGVLWEEELYVTGRIKDLIIINGRNIYPHDIEAQVSRLDPAFAGLFGSACSIPGKTEKILVMQELRVPDEGADLERLAREVCRELTRSLDVAVSNVAFLRRGEVRRTTSGKVRRAAMKELFLTGGLVTLHEELDPDVARRFRTEAPQPVPAEPGVPA